ncbi:hypothetical protein MASR2M78_09320 [Treponema sp.]
MPKLQADSLKGVPIDTASIQDTTSRYDDLRLLIGRLREVPYINSVPGALAAIDEASAKIVSEYAALLVASAASVRSRDTQISKLENRR